MSGDKVLQSRRNALKCMASGGAGTLFVLAGGVFSLVDLSQVADDKDDEPHTVGSGTGLFRLGAMDANEIFSFTFDKPGTCHFTCSIHPRLVGTIVVQ